MTDPAASTDTQTRDDVIVKLRGLIADLMRLESPDTVQESSLLVDDLGMDSLALVDLVTLVEESWAIRLVSTTDVTAIKTVGEVADLILDTQAQAREAS